MMSKRQQPEPLTARQQEWLGHVKACEEQGLGKTAYGQAHGIRPTRLYRWQCLLKQKGHLGGTAVKRKPTQEPTSWLPVVVKPPLQTQHRCQMRLPNGIELEWDQDYAVENLMQIVAGVSQR